MIYSTVANHFDRLLWDWPFTQVSISVKAEIPRLMGSQEEAAGNKM